MLGFNDMSTLVGHFVSSPREREKRDTCSKGDEREGQGRKRNRNESEETEEIKTFHQYPYLLQRLQALPNCKPKSVGRPGDVRYTISSPHPITPLSKASPMSVHHICLNIEMEHTIITQSIGTTGLYKQCRPRSDVAECSI